MSTNTWRLCSSVILSICVVVFERNLFSLLLYLSPQFLKRFPALMRYIVRRWKKSTKSTEYHHHRHCCHHHLKLDLNYELAHQRKRNEELWPKPHIMETDRRMEKKNLSSNNAVIIFNEGEDINNYFRI